MGIVEQVSVGSRDCPISLQRKSAVKHSSGQRPVFSLHLRRQSRTDADPPLVVSHTAFLRFLPHFTALIDPHTCLYAGCVAETSFWTTSRTARAINTAEATVRALADRGDLPCIRTSAGARLFRQEDVEAFIRARRRQHRRDDSTRPAA